MMKIRFILLVGFFALLNLRSQAQEKTELTYFYVETMNVESYRKFYNLLEKSMQLEIDYACVPAKIIGIKKDNVAFLEGKLTLLFKKVKEVELTQKEAENKCANQRSY